MVNVDLYSTIVTKVSNALGLLSMLMIRRHVNRFSMSLPMMIAVSEYDNLL